MTDPVRLAVTDLGGDPGLPLLVLGPSLGTSVATLWSATAAPLTDTFHVVGFDLPGHGVTEPATGFDMADLARGVLAAVDELAGPHRQLHYAGDSIGGAIGLQLLLDAPARIATATLMCTGAKIGEAAMWQERAAAVRSAGTESLLESTPARWFGPGFTEDHPAEARALLDALSAADDKSYAALCEALGGFDVRGRLAEVEPPVLAVAGSHDVATPTAGLRHVAEGVRLGRLAELEGVGHLAPAERPEEAARLIREHATTPPTSSTTTAAVRAAGMRVRREVLGDAHVDRASANTTAFTSEFQEMITQYAWGGIWTRTGLDRRSRSLITLTALVARGHHEELAMHVRAARTNGVSNDEIKELLLQTAIYCGVPDANTAFRIAQQVLADLDAPAADADKEQES